MRRILPSLAVVCLATACHGPSKENQRSSSNAALETSTPPQTARPGAVSIVNPWVRATPNPRMAAAYLTLRNSQPRKLKLL
jgi:copper(I)-binding protein